MDRGSEPVRQGAGNPGQDTARQGNTVSRPPAVGDRCRSGATRVSIILHFLLLLPVSAAMATVPAEHASIQGPFTTVAEVTAACLQCHPRAGDDLLDSIHWRWQRQRDIDGKAETYSKLDGLTNFGIVALTNPDRCLTCHISSTPSAETIAAARPESIDCLVCHDTSGTYQRGVRATPAELLRMASSAGRPRPANCKTCHSSSCGLGPGLQRAGFDSDVHLSPSGAGMSCQDCHPSDNHHKMARRLAKGKGIRSATGCRACHTDSPHRLERLNRHAELISCQTCHIPAYGRSVPVIVAWNWLLAGKTSGLFLSRHGGRGRFLTDNGFLLAKNVEPVYRWDNGSDRIYRRGDRITPSRMTILQEPAARRPNSRIRPFIVEYGTQPYDARYRYLVSPRLAPPGSGNIFPDANWETIARTGMNSFRLPYSGQHDFTTTLTYRRLDHGTVPAAQALDCMDCHGTSTRMDWQGLGYERDPWNDIQTPRTTVTTPGNGLPPIRETVLPVEADR